ncbi:response regulator transcription factor [Paracoccus shanxieyensis]|uniref:Response regulator n=1 Tax=Paracoccus shanxieyensis TaxID=2675752 RepID=A0A6L6IXE0_9RHOB|nr:response regulator transcription factor [Paracoccus shanxieyensis]MTH64278.1 response regulator [Paracoccus shanxieyensis]MTH87422.1 response regulator [Paracoccus shanxieyensis]
MPQSIARADHAQGFAHALIVDDHPLFCDALAMTLTGPVGIAQVETARTLEAAIQHIAQRGMPDVVVLDLNLPDVNGIDGVVRMRQMDAELPIIVVSSMTDLRVVRASLQAGATAFLPKHAEREEIREAFVTIASGAPHSSRKVLDNSAATPSEEAVQRLAQLTRQQACILQLVCAGLMNKQIAYEMSIAETTVKAHVTAIMRKLGVQSRMQAVLLAQSTSFAALSKEG